MRADGNLQDVVIPARYFGLPKYKRDYKAVEFFWERNSEVWSLQGSYTWSKSQGNVEGYLNSTLEQDDAGLTQDFDFAIFEAGADGPLPNDRRHTLKTFGTYSLTPEWRLGGNALIQSGRPVNCTGFAPLDNPDYPLGIDDGSIPSYGASAFFCLDAAGNTVQSQRGDRGRTPWIYTFDASIQYIPAWANQQLDLKIDVFNIFNSSRVTEYSETGETVRGIQNLNFLNDQNYQTPRSVLFSVRYKF